jgi:hypothetical protein
MLPDSVIQLSSSEFFDWLQKGATKEVFRALQLERGYWTDRLLSGDTLTQTGREALETAKAVGIVYGLDCILVGLEARLREQWGEEAAQLVAVETGEAADELY